MARTKKKKKISLPKMVGDHGPGTDAATKGTVVELMVDEAGRTSPNNVGRRRRTSEIDRLAKKLTMRQEQAARAISDAHCRVEMLSSGGELKEQVDSSPKPDATIDAQVSAQSQLVHVMRGVPNNPPECREVIEHVCWKGLPISDLASGRRHGAYMACLKVTLDLVANRLRY